MFEPGSSSPLFKRPWLKPLVVALMLAAGASVWLGAQVVQDGRIGQGSADPAYIVVNTPTTVTFTTVISDSSLRKHDPQKVLLVRTDAAGTPIDILGRMLDDGRRADAKRNDHTYTDRVTLNEPVVGPIYFKVAARFKEPLPRFGKNDDNDWDRDLASLDDPRAHGNRHDRLPSLLRKLQGYTLTDPITVIVDPFRLPPDPGEAGKQTIEGIDSDHDGVRDDVQRYIALTYPGQTPARSAVTQYAVAIQEYMKAISESKPTLPTLTLLVAATRCMAYVDVDGSAKLGDALDDIALNTKERMEASWKSWEAVHELAPAPLESQLLSFCISSGTP